MKRRQCLFFLFGVTWTLLAGPAFPSVSSPPQPLLFGTAKTEITPPAGTPLAGYGKRRGKPSAGIHDPLFARALALSLGEQTYVFVSADLVLIDEELRQEILKKIRARVPLREDQLLLFATHTHSGAGAIGSRYWERFIMGKFKKPVFEKMTGQISEAVIEALEKKIPVSAEFGSISIENLVENRMDPRIWSRIQIQVLRFLDATGKLQGQMIFMAAHPTMFPALDFQFSADFPGVVTETLEKKFPDSLALFVNGAAADLRPRTPTEENRILRMKFYGLALAERVEKISFQLINLKGPWKSAFEESRLPRTKIRLGRFRVPSFLGNRVFPRKAAFQILRLGPLCFFAFPGELASETGLALERQARLYGLIPFVVGYANDYLAYVIPRYHYQNRDHYESRTSFYGPKMDWFVEEQYRRLLKRAATEGELQELQKPGRLSRRQGIPVLRLSGDPYHRGFEEGRLLQKEIREGAREIFRYFRSELPVPLLNRVVIRFLLGRAWKKMEPFVTHEEYLQMKGLAGGSGVSFRKIKSLHALPEVYPTWCSNGAYWGAATEGGRLIAIRNLDWNRKIGIHRFAAVKFHEAGGQIRYANIGYYGFTGVLSGINEEGISVGQIGAASSEETMEGVPMPFLLKRILEEAGSLEDAKRIFQTIRLTRGYNYVIADAKERRAFAAEATARHLAFFSDHDPAESGIPYAVSLKNALLRSDTALDPAIRNLQWASKGDPEKPGLEPPAGSAYEIRYRKHAALVQDSYGILTAEIAKYIAKEIAPGSNIQSVVYAFPEFWVANAEGEKRAVDGEWVRFDFNEDAS